MDVNEEVFEKRMSWRRFSTLLFNLVIHQESAYAAMYDKGSKDFKSDRAARGL